MSAAAIVLPATLAFALLACAALALSGQRVQQALFARALAAPHRRMLRAAALACLAGTWLGGWAAAGEPLFAWMRAAPPPPLVLLGEVHDHAQQHAIRYQAFEALVASGARPALLLEQFDRERQPDIERARAQPGADADAIVAAASVAGSRWHWAHYKPFIALALKHGLPIVAANVSRSDARRVISEGLQALAFDDRVPPDIAAAQAEAITAAHCGTVDAAQGLRMAAAQIARDQFMARLVERHAGQGAVLLAGNGHVRRDIGVPRWLPGDLGRRVKSIGLLEEGDDIDRAAFDHSLVMPRQPREDPCAALRPSVGRAA